MKLYLAQHGEAAAKEVDPERPLTEKGIDAVRRMAIALDAAGVNAARVLHSGKLRARETADILAFKIAHDVEPEIDENLQPNDDPDIIRAQIDDWREDTLLVGHLPFMGRLLALLVCGDADSPLVSFQPGSVACLERDADGTWRLDWMMRPELLS